MKILSVDDSKTIRMIVKRSFAPYDVTLLEACNGAEGLAAATAEKPDLIVLDVTMPVMDGVTMLTKIKENADLKNIPVIMLTSESSRENVIFIAKLGVRDYMVKPFQGAQLIEKVKRVVTLQPKPELVAVTSNTRFAPQPLTVTARLTVPRAKLDRTSGVAGKRRPSRKTASVARR